MQTLRILEQTAYLWGVNMKKIDLTSKVFGRLLVLSESERAITQSGQVKRRWNVKCECGTVKVVRQRLLTSGGSKSCGCLKKDHPNNLIHGKTKHPSFPTWRAMIARCTNPKNIAYKYYGARGITVCDQWLDVNSFIFDMGEKPRGMSIERIDLNGNYEPSNCKWATKAEQSRNTRRNTCSIEKAQKVRDLANGGIKKVEIARLIGIHPETVRQIINGTRWAL